ELLKSQPQTDAEKVAAIGYCFGGTTVLGMARAGLDLDGVVSFHGILATETPAEKGKVKAKVL
ncbi:MAG: dienelactone hydrolase family protein, partial [Candidatus Dadabacteria bacterium]|nr:dienelactone hydrolase family protein [Candidatus Dadabacteria bacterium]NIV42121.1 dienelactone hydrolase family protein [Candidatus Dadabacteria bacterium]NIX15854.1 dienelactone hydrolase family protein [Candidatus Dadabacteria bacterium]